MTQAWVEYGSLERTVEELRAALQAQMSHSASPQVRAGTAVSRPSERANASRCRLQQSELKRELWRIEDVLAGLSASKANFRITVDSVQNPGGFLLPGRRSGVSAFTGMSFFPTVSPSNREEICAFDVRPDGAFSEGGGPASSSLPPLSRHRSDQQRHAHIGKFLGSSSSRLPLASVKGRLIPKRSSA